MLNDELEAARGASRTSPPAISYAQRLARGVVGTSAPTTSQSAGMPIAPAPAPIAPAPNGYGATVRPANVRKMAGQAADVATAAAPVVAPGMTAVVQGATEDVKGALASGNYAAAAGQAARGVLALPIAAAADTMGRVQEGTANLLAPVARGVANVAYTAATGNNQLPVSSVQPAPTAVPGARGAVRPPLEENAPVAIPAGAVPAAAPADPVAGVVSAAPQRSVMDIEANAGRIQREMADFAASGAYAQPGAMSNGAGVRVIEDASLFGNGAPARSVLETRGLSARQRANLEVQREQIAAGRANNQESNASARAGQEASAGASRYGADINARTADKRLAADAPEQAAKTQLAQSTLAARQSYAKALASGDPKQVQAAENNLRATQGRYEKEAQDNFTTTAIPAGIDPATGQPRGAGAIVTNRRDGSVRIITADEAKGQSGKPQFVVDKVYRDGKGNTATWDGTKFIPTK